MARSSVSWMRVVAILLVALVVWWGKRGQEEDGRRAGGAEAPPAIEGLEAGEWIEVTGRVERSLKDDTRPPRHQRFILGLPSGETLLVAHNIDLAPRVPLVRGDEVVVRGEYEPNQKGGVIHWTHRDPDGRRPGGWIRHEGKQYR